MSGVWVSGRYLVVVRPKSLIGAKTRRLELHRLWRAFGSHGVVTIQHRCDTGTIGPGSCSRACELHGEHAHSSMTRHGAAACTGMPTTVLIGAGGLVRSD